MGIDQDRFVDASPELICCICTGVLEDPVESPCRHVFCSDCIARWLRNKSNCPNCRSDIRTKTIKPALPLIKNIISKLKIKCDFANRGCKMVVALEALKSHCKGCTYAPVKCPHNSCGKEVSKKDLDKHKRSCLKRVLTCPKGCGIEVVFSEMIQHNCVKDLKKLVDEQGKKLASQEERLEKLEGQVRDLKNNISRIDQRQMDHRASYSPQSPTSSVAPRARRRGASSSPEAPRIPRSRRRPMHPFRTPVSLSRSRSRSRSPLSQSSATSDSRSYIGLVVQSPGSPVYSPQSSPYYLPTSPVEVVESPYYANNDQEYYNESDNSSDRYQSEDW